MVAHYLDLMSISRATDAAYLAAADIAKITTTLDVPYRLVGGNSVTLLIAVHDVANVPARDTADADLGAAYEVVGDPRLPAALLGFGYERTAGNRFEREHPDTADPLRLTVDVLAPAFGPVLQENQPHGDLVVDEVPGLGLALARDPVIVDVLVALTSANQLAMQLLLPDPVSALCMKAGAYRGRLADRDALDIWRLLETAYVAGVRATQWTLSDARLDAARVLHRHFGAVGMNPFAILSVDPAVSARVRALIHAVVAKPVP